MDSRALRIGFGVAAAVGAAALAVRGLLPRRRVEGPHYDVEDKQMGIELRRYPSRVVAETTVAGPYDESLRTGFRRLAGYIFGHNAPHERIAMTTPVEERSARTIPMTTPVEATPGVADGEWQIAFTMPTAYAGSELPIPIDPRVRIAERPARRLAALRFSGRANHTLVRRKERALLEAMGLLGLRPCGRWTVARYDPPWTPWFLRRNEVLVPVS